MGIEETVICEDVQKIVDYFDKSIPEQNKGVTYHAYIEQLQQTPKVPEWLKDPQTFRHFHGFLSVAHAREVNMNPLIFDPDDFKRNSSYARYTIDGDPARILNASQKRQALAARRREEAEKSTPGSGLYVRRNG